MLWAAVPETAINKHGHTPTGEHHVGRAALGQLSVEPEPDSSRMKRLTKADLGGCVFLAATGKVPAFGGAHPLLGHPRRLAREGYCLLLQQLLFERVGSWRQHVGAWVELRTQDR
jgi:hypothetical protein